MKNLEIVFKQSSDKGLCGKITISTADGDTYVKASPAHGNGVSVGTHVLDTILESDDDDTVGEFGTEALKFGDFCIYSGRLGRDGRIREAHPGDIRISPADYQAIRDIARRAADSGAGVYLTVKNAWFNFGFEAISRTPRTNVSFKTKRRNVSDVATPSQRRVMVDDDEDERSYRHGSNSNGIDFADVMFMNSFPEVAPFYRPDSLYAWYVWYNNRENRRHTSDIPVRGFDGVEQRIEGDTVVLYKNGVECGRIRMNQNGAVMQGDNGCFSTVEINDGNIVGRMDDGNGNKASMNGTQGDNGYDMSGDWKFEPAEGLPAQGSVSFDGSGLSLDAFDKPESNSSEGYDGGRTTVSLDKYDAPAAQSGYDFGSGGNTTQNGYDFGSGSVATQTVEVSRSEETSNPFTSSGSDPYDRS